MARYSDKYWWSNDGLRLHYRDYPADPEYADRPPLLCLPGLTRNARDFTNLAERMAGQWRIVCPEMRGRAESAHAKDAMTYVPLTYVQDLEALFIELSLNRFVAIGTSLGGIITMLLASTRPDRLAGVLLNDIGPVLEETGLDRIKSTVGTGSAQPTWMHAARSLADTMQIIYPDYKIEDWLALAKRLYRLNSSGRVVLDYDARISEALRVPGSETSLNLWPSLAALRDTPTLIVRGELSDLFSVATAQRMQADIGPQAELITVPRVGHAPTLDEPEALAALDRLLERVLAQG